MKRFDRDSVPTFDYARCVDLSRPLRADPALHRWVHYDTSVESIVENPDEVPPEGRWYIVTHITMGGHAGTHVEAPRHAVEGGADVAEVDVTRFFGEAAILDLSQVPWSQPFGIDTLEAAAEPAGGVRDGDIAFLRFDWDRRSPGAGYPPYPTTAATSWLVDRGIKLLGIDSPGLEVQGDKGLPNHNRLFHAGVPLIESLANLEQLQRARVYVFALTLPAHDTDAIPLRVLAFEG
jgi:arylformamidase